MVAAEDKSETLDDSVKLPEEEKLLSATGTTEGITDVSAATRVKEPSVGENGNLKTDHEDDLPNHTKKRRISDIVLELKGSEEITCGLWCLKGSCMQRLASKKVYLLVYCVAICLQGATSSYLNGTISTIERRYKIPSTNTGIILAGCDISQLFLCMFINYYAGKGHRPRWMVFGTKTIVLFCFMNALPHFLYGPGEDALSLTMEYGGQDDSNTTAILVDEQNRKYLCQRNSTGAKCEDTSGNLAPQAIFFISQLISGVGESLYYTLGTSYMDDNIKKTKTPALVSMTYFFRMLGPAAGYTLATVCLSTYISPSLTPTINPEDPRWIGAWWLGWLILGVLILVSGSLMVFFPKSLPRAAARRILAAEQRQEEVRDDPIKVLQHEPISFKDMKVTFARLLKNKTFMCNNFASVFYFMGYMPYWVFMSKYIETIYKQTASFAAFITGSVGIVFTAIGIVSAGGFISKFKPSARALAAWNVVVGAISVLGIISYSLLGCPVNDQQGAMLASGQMATDTACNTGCHCDYVQHSPVCSPDGRTFISPCHAGCQNYEIVGNGTKVYLDCACAPKPPQIPTLGSLNTSLSIDTQRAPEEPWVLKEGPCPIDCSTHFFMFVVVMCVLKFNGGTGRTSNFLVSMRCVEEKDKSAAMGLGLMFMSLFAFIPSPILFGYFIDLCCMVWGKTCSGTGNCWLYNTEMLRYLMNLTAAVFVSIGTLFDYAVWYYVKDLKIFDEEAELEVAPQRQKTQRK